MAPLDPQDTSIELSIIIVNYNVAPYLAQCLESVFNALEGIEGEVFVVDNNSQDESLTMLQDSFESNIHLITNTDNPGFSKANNQAIKLARGKYVLLLNPDTLVQENTFQICLNFMNATPHAGALGVYMQDGEGKFLPESKRSLPTPWVSFYKIFGLSALFPNNETFGKYHLTYLNKEQNHPIEILSGAFMFMNKQALDKIGYLDESYFMYGEDIDLSYRFLLGGYQNYYLADTKILHYKGESTKKGSLNYVKIFYQAMLIFADKHFKGKLRKGFSLSIRIAVYLRAVLAILKRGVDKLGFPVFEGGLIFAILYGVQAYWEHYVKYIEGQGGAYPWIFEAVYLPVYAVVFVSFLAISGAYQKPYRIKPLFIGPFWAFICIATTTYLFPIILNFSRAIVGLSAVFTAIFALAIRGFLHWKNQGNFFFDLPKTKKSILIGHPKHLEQAWKVLHQELNYPSDILGVISSIGPLSEDHPLFKRELGSVKYMGQLSNMYKSEEWIFCLQDLSYSWLLDTMATWGPKGIQFKTLPHAFPAVIGPKQIFASPLTGSFSSPLFRSSIRLRKRIVEVIVALLMILLFPIMSFGYLRPKLAWKALISVLKGSHHLVGYLTPSLPNLPPIKPGWLNLSHRISTEMAIKTSTTNLYYAKNYSPTLDLELLYKGWRKLGVQP
ncbi:MAG: glycosyltransferase [Bacteroidota bacterium]